MPGSPPTSRSEPGTTPPPSTRSNSGMPVASRVVAASSMSASGAGARAAVASTQRRRPAPPGASSPAPRRPAERPGAVASAAPAGASTSVFHASQAGQRPNQRGDSLPQALQKYGRAARFREDFMNGLRGGGQAGSASEHRHLEVLPRVRPQLVDEGAELDQRGLGLVVELAVVDQAGRGARAGVELVGDPGEDQG